MYVMKLRRAVARSVSNVTCRSPSSWRRDSSTSATRIKAATTSTLSESVTHSAIDFRLAALAHGESAAAAIEAGKARRTVLV